MTFDSIILNVLSSGAFGYSPRELVGQPLLMITPPAQRMQLQHTLGTPPPS